MLNKIFAGRDGVFFLVTLVTSLFSKRGSRCNQVLVTSPKKLVTLVTRKLRVGYKLVTRLSYEQNKNFTINNWLQIGYNVTLRLGNPFCNHVTKKTERNIFIL